MSLPSVLFVCGRNAIRSPMGEALWRLRFGNEATARSCGVIPAAFVDPFMVAVMLEKKVDLEDFSPIALNGVGEPPADIIVSLSTAADRMAKEYAARTGAEFQAWPIPDPSETGGNRDMKIAAYRETRDAIAAQVAQWEPTPKSA
ncbi:low molecular weight phosphatase family protein [Maricaulis sp.]|uniref:arsenate-mycothiol transferase ArsC n=1 Tax=Maricaulis sp. TaxID=1486257 RepID=UPI0025EC8559|nr:low molecular weight phosphatase family protein [Maricaulis sp.]MDF1767514.1 low molecular weight phosphatase family protein [Maricaulis sp.]